jgi:hypothetical protein
MEADVKTIAMARIWNDWEVGTTHGVAANHMLRFEEAIHSENGRNMNGISPPGSAMTTATGAARPA